MPAPLRVCVSAGEPSGDRHAANLVRALSSRRPDAVVEGVGGPEMADAGVRLIARMESLSTMGFAEPVTHFATHAVLLARLRRRFTEQRYDLVIVVDYPGFNLRVARAARAAGIPVLYYIAPQAWAWAPGRAEALRRSVRALAVILPFEEAFFTSRGVPAQFVGHPLLDAQYPTRETARTLLKVDARAPLLALLPGSRPHEVRRLWPTLRAAASRLRAAHPGLQIVVAAARGCTYPDAGGIHVAWDASAATLAAADVTLCKAGTATLEAALLGVPSVVVYRTDALSYAIARRVARVPFVGLANLLAGQDVVPELIQGNARPDAMAAAVLPLLDREGAAAQAQRAAYAAVRRELGSPGASGRTAAMALDLVA